MLVFCECRGLDLCLPAGHTNWMALPKQMLAVPLVSVRIGGTNVIGRKGCLRHALPLNTVTWWDQTISSAPSKAAHQPGARLSACLSLSR